MKKLITLLLISISFTGYAQMDKSKELSNAEKFTDRAGSLIQKEFIDVGDLKKCKIQVAKYTDLIDQKKTNAVRFEYEYSSGSFTDTKLALLDVDEIDALLKSLKLIQENILSTKANNYTEVSYRSRSGFEAGCFSKKDSWNFYIKLERFDSKSYVFLDKDDLPKLISLIDQAKAKL